LGICAYEAGLLLARRRPPTPVDYGEVGDVVGRNGRGLRQLVEAGFWPVIAPLTASPEGHLLNTNADTIACEVACALQETGLQVELVLAFELPGVLEEVNRPESLIRHLDYDTYTRMQAAGQVHAGMLPKLDNAFRAAQAGVQVRLGTPWDWLQGTPRATFLESSSPNPQC
jgi:acetylglutamate kinase